MKQWTTTQDFITYGGKGLPVGTIIETSGFSAKGDGGGAKWQSTTVTGAPSQTPAQLGDALLNDASGRQWKLVFKNQIMLSKLGARTDLADCLAITQAAINAVNLAGGGDVIAEAIYKHSNRVLLKNNVRIISLGYRVGGFIATDTNPSINGKLFGATSGTTGFTLKDLVLDGNVAANTATTPLMQFFNAKKWNIEGCDIRNSAGIAVNISTTNDEINIKKNRFYNIGFTAGVGGVNAKQAIAISGTVPHNIGTICDNEFASIGLDCISFGGVKKYGIYRNKHVDANCYTLVYSVAGVQSYDVDVCDNVAFSAINVVGSVRPQGNGLDLPSITGLLVSGNNSSNNSASGIGIFTGSKNVSISNNICLNNNQSGLSPYKSGINIKGDGTTGVQNVTLSANICSDNQTVKTQQYGLSYDDVAVTGLVISRDNILSGNAVNEIAQKRYTSPVDSGTVFGSRKLLESIIKFDASSVAQLDKVIGIAVDDGANWSGVNATGLPRPVFWDGANWIAMT